MSKRETACATPAAFRQISSDTEATASTSAELLAVLLDLVRQFLNIIET
jgi:hypothetical protein